MNWENTEILVSSMHLFFCEKKEKCALLVWKPPHTIKQNVFFHSASFIVFLTETDQNASYIRQSTSTRWRQPPFCAVRGIREVKYICVCTASSCSSVVPFVQIHCIIRQAVNVGYECSFFPTFSLAPVSSVSIAIIVNERTAFATSPFWDLMHLRNGHCVMLMGAVFRHKGGVEAQVVNSWQINCKQMLELGPRSPCKTAVVPQTASFFAKQQKIKLRLWRSHAICYVKLEIKHKRVHFYLPPRNEAADWSEAVARCDVGRKRRGP